MYSVAINSDRVHISLNETPVETILFTKFYDPPFNDKEEAKQAAIGYAVVKSIKLNYPKEKVVVEVK